MTPLTHTLRAWSRASDHVVSSMLEANRATFAAMGVDDDLTASSSSTETQTEPTVQTRTESNAETLPSITHEASLWSFDRTVEEPAAIDVGDSVTFSKTVSDEDVHAFAHASGDTNRLHLDDDFAEHTRFGERIVHGTLVSGLISAALARLPGVTVYLSQDLEFVGPVSIGDRLTASVEILESLGENRYRLETTVSTDDGVVVDGEAVVLVDALPVVGAGD